MKRNVFRTRSDKDDALKTRKFSVKAKGGAGSPATLNEDARSVDILIASETDQIMVYDWDLDRSVPEILVMSGCQLPENGQVPLLDSHGRYSVADVFGSVRDFDMQADKLDGIAYYSQTTRASEAFEKTKEGHLTDYSAGFRVLKEMKLDENQTTEIDGRTYTGPCILITEWALKEVSTCPIGADPTAKARAEKHKQPATPPAAPQKKENTVDEKLKAFLIRRGLKEDATEAEAYAFLERLENPDKENKGERSAGDGEDVDKIRSDEQDRIRSITAMCEKHECADLADSLIDENKTIDQARTAVLSHIETRREKKDENLPGFRASVVVEGRDKFSVAAQDAMLVRAGVHVENPALGHDDLTGFSMVELARRSLNYANQSDRGNPMEMVGRALTSSDFPIILGNIANMTLAEAYESAEETWTEFCAEGSVNDFKQQTIARASEADDLDEITEDGEYKFGSLDEAKENYTLATFGKKGRISRVAIINDDMSALTDMPAKYGESAARKIGDAVFAVVTANAAMGDGTALFHASHGNLGAGAVIGTAGFGAGIKAMGLQKDIKGKRRLNIRPHFVLAPYSIEAVSEVFFQSEYFDGTDKSATRKNIYAGSKYKRVYESRLDDDSQTAWYLLGPKGKTIKVFFLNGNKKPYMESRQGWNVDGLEFKIRIDAVAKALDWKTMYKNPGA